MSLQPSTVPTNHSTFHLAKLHLGDLVTWNTQAVRNLSPLLRMEVAYAHNELYQVLEETAPYIYKLRNIRTNSTRCTCRHILLKLAELKEEEPSHVPGS